MLFPERRLYESHSLGETTFPSLLPVVGSPVHYRKTPANGAFSKRRPFLGPSGGSWSQPSSDSELEFLGGSGSYSAESSGPIPWAGDVSFCQTAWLDGHWHTTFPVFLPLWSRLHRVAPDSNDDPE